MSEKFKIPQIVDLPPEDAEAYRNQEDNEKGVLETPEVFDAAEPYMEVVAEMLSSGDSETDRSGANLMLRYAEAKAKSAVPELEVEEPKGLEARVLETYKAQANLNRATETVDLDKAVSGANIEKAAMEAWDRSRAADDAREKTRWLDMARKLQRYDKYNSLNDSDPEILAEFTASSRNAQMLLNHSFAPEAKGRITATEQIGAGDLRRDIVNMNSQAEMYRFLAELHPSEEYLSAGEQQYRERVEAFTGRKVQPRH